ncbi:MAG: hypothetical protein PVI86_06980, partial [Phycisphaerae bacterium]
MPKVGRSMVASAVVLSPCIWVLSVQVFADERSDSLTQTRDRQGQVSDPQDELTQELFRDYWITAGPDHPGETYQNLTLPEGSFGDDCETFGGRVYYQGVPLDNHSYGQTDTILQRSHEPVRLRDPVGTMGTVDLVLTELNLVSIDPITVMCDDGERSFDINVGLSSQPAPTGWLTATKTDPNGGTFESTFYLYPYLTFTNVGDHDEVYELDMADTSDPIELSG